MRRDAEVARARGGAWARRPRDRVWQTSGTSSSTTSSFRHRAYTVHERVHECFSTCGVDITSMYSLTRGTERDNAGRGQYRLPVHVLRLSLCFVSVHECFLACGHHIMYSDTGHSLRHAGRGQYMLIVQGGASHTGQWVLRSRRRQRRAPVWAHHLAARRALTCASGSAALAGTWGPAGWRCPRRGRCPGTRAAGSTRRRT